MPAHGGRNRVKMTRVTRDPVRINRPARPKIEKDGYAGSETVLRPARSAGALPPESGIVQPFGFRCVVDARCDSDRSGRVAVFSPVHRRDAGSERNLPIEAGSDLPRMNRQAPVSRSRNRETAQRSSFPAAAYFISINFRVAVEEPVCN